MRKYSPLGALVFSFFSRDLYRDVAHGWRGIGFLHLLLLAVAISTPLAVKAHLALHSAAERDFPKYVKDFPEVRVDKGIVSSAVAQPFILYEDSTKRTKAFFALDTTGKIKSFEDTDASMLVTKTRVFIRGHNNEERSFELKALPDFVINSAKLCLWMGLLARWFGVVVFLFLFIGSILWGFIAIGTLAVIGVVFAGASSTLSTAAYLRLASVARTPVILTDIVLTHLKLSIPMWWLISTGLAVAYMIFAVDAALEVPRKEPTVDPPRPEPPAELPPPLQAPPQG